ncbi:hypothetical protein CKAN_01172900 [Cinnamomum micranthum f. kanehirae]|uniref:Uncharacterized protein n=1 Tax=Cinnamomum micranthum f. kanehirae TaxID=337451 RepID=A0A443NWV3_9MAGN|nr:hypothetical protein CKAN_01172900 [Cinnamomum micranthum f. kanehirae]
MVGAGNMKGERERRGEKIKTEATREGGPTVVLDAGGGADGASFGKGFFLSELFQLSCETFFFSVGEDQRLVV